MKKEEYEIMMIALLQEYKGKRTSLAIEYAMSNNTVNLGDMVSDHMGTVKVDKIMVSGIDNPECVYHGVEYTQKGAPRKDGNRRGCFQGNIKQNI